MPLISSFVISAATRIGLKLAEKRKWLPGRAYCLLAIDKLKQGDIDGAAQFNAIARQKNPKDDKAQLVDEIIAMRRDAAHSALLSRLAIIKRRQEQLGWELAQNKKKFVRLKRCSTLEMIGGWFLVTIIIFGFVAAYFCYLYNYVIESSVLGGVMVALTIASIFLLRQTRDRKDEQELQRLELLAAQRALINENAVLEKRVEQIENEISTNLRREI